MKLFKKDKTMRLMAGFAFLLLAPMLGGAAGALSIIVSAAAFIDYFRLKKIEQLKLSGKSP
jgi:hypothetical protein